MVVVDVLIQTVEVKNEENR